MVHKGNLKDIVEAVKSQGDTSYRELQKLLSVLNEFIDKDEIAVVYPRIALADSEYGMDDGFCLELIVFTEDGRILAASVLPEDRFEMVLTNKSEICNMLISRSMTESSQEIRPALTINFKDGSKLDLNSEEDANDYWGEDYPELIKMIIKQLR